MPTRKIKDIDQKQICLSTEHYPPQHMVYDPGIWEHVCPSCGKKSTFTVTGVIF